MPPRTSDDERPTHQTSVYLTDQDVDLLDTVALELRRTGWRAAQRSQLVRGLIRVLRDSAPNLAGVRSEGEFAAAVKRAIRETGAGGSESDTPRK
jgi:hypothetical protein